jgi:PAS domain S-box-containing protein
MDDHLQMTALPRNPRQSPALRAAVLLLALGTLLGTLMVVLVTGYVDEASLLNHAGRQRMLSQEIAFSVLQARSRTPGAAAELAEEAAELVESQRVLDMKLNELPLSPSVASYVAAGRRAVASPTDPTALAAFVDRRKPLLEALEQSVADRVIYDRVRRERFIGLIIGSFAFLGLVMVGAAQLLVRPFEKTIVADRQRFASLFAMNPDAVVMLDTAGLTMMVNPAARAMLGYTTAEMVGKTFGAFVPSELHEAAAAAFERLLRSEKVTFETKLRAKDGTSIVASGYAVPITADGAVDGIFAVFHEVAHEREREHMRQMMATALDSAGDLVLVTDATPLDEGGPRIMYANRAYLDEFRYDLEEIVGRSPAIFYGPGTRRETIRAIANDIESGSPAGNVFLAYRRDGTAFDIEIHGRPIPGGADSRGGWVAIGRNVSVRKRNDDHLLALRTAVDEARDRVTVYAVDPSGRRASRAMYVNAAAVRSSGYTAAELLRMPLPVTEASQSDLITLHETIGRGLPVRTRLELRHADGSLYWGEIDARPVFDSSGTLTHWISIERDISETVRREYELAAEKATLDALLTVVRQMFATFTNEDLEAAMLGGVQTIFAANGTIHEEAGDDALLQVAVRGGGVAFDIREGRAAFAVPSLHVGRRPMIVDITNLGEEHATQNDMYAMQLFAETFVAANYNVALYDELADRREAIGEINQAKSDLIAMLAHDLKNPLTTILGYAELVEEGALAGAEAADAMRPIIKAVQRLSALANDTLALARMERNELDVDFDALDYVTIVNDVVAQHRDERTIVFEPPPAPIVGVGDAARLRQALENLIANAIKYSPSGAPIDVALASDDRYVTFVVADRGIGIPHDEKGYIFERFARASNAQASRITGTGFGLYLVRAIVEQHGGTVTVDDRDGGGTVFTVMIAQHMQPYGYDLPTIVIVDPSGDVASAAAQALREGGYRTRVVRRAAQAATAIERAEARLVVIDVDSVARVERCEVGAVRGGGWTVPTLCLAVQPRDVTIANAATLAKPYLESDFLALVAQLIEAERAPAATVLVV